MSGRVDYSFEMGGGGEVCFRTNNEMHLTDFLIHAIPDVP
jgi:hypothetical protein